MFIKLGDLRPYRRWTSLKTEIKLLKSDAIELFLYFKSNDQIIFIKNII